MEFRTDLFDHLFYSNSEEEQMRANSYLEEVLVRQLQG
jgi:hypothetical protein